MSRIYDDWERLVAATLDREKLRELALVSSRETSFSSSASTLFNSSFNFKFKSDPNLEPAGGSFFHAAILKAEQAARVSENATSFKQECLEIKSKAEKIALLLRQAAREKPELYHQPARHVMAATENVLLKTISLVLKCQGLKRYFAANNLASFQGMSSKLDQSIANICWLLRDEHYRGVPPIAADEPVLCNIWELIAILHTGSVEDRCDAIASLVSLASACDAYGTLIVEEGCGIQPLVRLMEEGTPTAQENVVKLIALLGKKNLIVMDNKVTSMFLRILEQDPPIKLQGTVAWAVSELAIVLYYEAWHFAYILGKLAVKTLPGDCRVQLALGSATRGNNSDDKRNTSQSKAGNIAIEKQDQEIKDYIKVMATRGLWHIAKESNVNCKIIATSKALFSFAVFLDRGPDEARFNSAMALVHITSMVVHDPVQTKTDMPTYKAVLDQLFRIIDQEESKILVPCVKVVGNLAKRFRDTETRMISPLVKLLDEREAKVSREACIALSKFAQSNNSLYPEHLKTIVKAGGLNFLIRLVYFGEKLVQCSALKLLCYIALTVPQSELAQVEMLSVLEWASKHDSTIDNLNLWMLLQQAIRDLRMSLFNYGMASRR